MIFNVICTQYCFKIASTYLILNKSGSPCPHSKTKTFLVQNSSKSVKTIVSPYAVMLFLTVRKRILLPLFSAGRRCYEALYCYVQIMFQCKYVTPCCGVEMMSSIFLEYMISLSMFAHPFSFAATCSSDLKIQEGFGKIWNTINVDLSYLPNEPYKR